MRFQHCFDAISIGGRFFFLSRDNLVLGGSGRAFNFKRYISRFRFEPFSLFGGRAFGVVPRAAFGDRGAWGGVGRTTSLICILVMIFLLTTSCLLCRNFMKVVALLQLDL